MLYQRLCELKGMEANKSLSDFLPPAAIGCVTLASSFTEADIARLVHLTYDVRRDDGILLRHLADEGFDSLRKNYPTRREFSTVMVEGDSTELAVLAQLGFTTAN